MKVATLVKTREQEVNYAHKSKYKHYAIIIVFFILPFLSYCQFKVSGIVKNTEGQAVVYANVLIRHIADQEKEVQGATTGDHGNFIIHNVAAGDYRISVSFIGFKTWEDTIEVSGDTVLEEIVLEANTTGLDEVVVEGQRPLIERKVDRLVFNVAQSISASGGTVIDALRLTPGVQVDDNSIQMIGKGTLKVMVDGRLLQLGGEELNNFLQSLASDDIKSIEVINNPPAKYEAEGNSGLINIVFKKGRKDAWSASIRGSYRQGTYPIASLGGTYIYTKGKWNISSNINANNGRRQIYESSTIFYPENTWANMNDRKDYQKSLSGRIAADYQLTENSSFGMQYMGGLNDPDRRFIGHTDIYNVPRTALDSVIQSLNETDAESYNHVLNFHYKNDLDTIGRSFSVDLDYFKFSDRKNSPVETVNYYPDMTPTGTYSLAENASDQNIENYSLRLDMEYPTSLVNLSYGGKVSFTKTDNDTHFFDKTSGTSILDPNQTDHFIYEENTQALYIDVVKKISKSWEAKAGLRVEGTQTKGVSESLNQINKNNYIKLFPTAYLSYTPNDNHNFNLSYGKRINRPSFWELNPFRWYVNAYVYVDGNPFLQPSYADNLEFTHTFKRKLISNLYLNFVTNGYSQVPNVDPDSGIQYYTRENYYTKYTFGIRESYTIDPLPWWSSMNEITLYYSDSRTDTEVDFDTELLSGTGFHFSTVHTFTFNEDKTIKGEVRFWYSDPGSTNQLFEIDPSYRLDLGMKFLFLDKSLELSANFNDVFQTSIADAVTNTYGVRQAFNIDWEPHYFRISATYRFGNNKIKAKQRDFGNEDEMQRSN